LVTPAPNFRNIESSNSAGFVISRGTPFVFIIFFYDAQLVRRRRDILDTLVLNFRNKNVYTFSDVVSPEEHFYYFPFSLMRAVWERRRAVA
jgi:hypothetical protein